MYSELYEAWKRELENPELQMLPSEFFSNLAGYLRKLREESRMLDKRTAKAKLLSIEIDNVRRMTREIVKSRYKKIIAKPSHDEKIADCLTVEEKKLLKMFLSVSEMYRDFTRNLLQGRLLEIENVKANENVALRFLKDVPAVIGSDMKPYGPFKTEDVASVPKENADILVKQGLAEKIEIS